MWFATLAYMAAMADGYVVGCSTCMAVAVGSGWCPRFCRWLVGSG